MLDAARLVQIVRIDQLDHLRNESRHRLRFRLSPFSFDLQLLKSCATGHWHGKKRFGVHAKFPKFRQVPWNTGNFQDSAAHHFFAGFSSSVASSVARAWAKDSRPRELQNFGIPYIKQYIVLNDSPMCGFNKLLIPISLLFNWQSSSISWGQDQGQHRWPTGNRWERCGHRDSLPGEVERPAAVLWSTAVIWQVIPVPLFTKLMNKLRDSGDLPPL